MKNTVFRIHEIAGKNTISERNIIHRAKLTVSLSKSSSENVYFLPLFCLNLCLYLELTFEINEKKILMICYGK